MQATLGIDFGTSAVKVAAVGLDGSLLGETSRPYPTHRPAPGRAEQSPGDWWEAGGAAVRELVARLPDCEFVGIGLSGQVNGMVLLDAEDVPLGEAIIWLDTRSHEEAAALEASHGALLRERAATRLTAIAVLSKLAWLARHEAERMTRARSLLMVKDYIFWRLTGERITDPTDAASTGMFDHDRFEWIAGLAAAAGFDPAILPPVGRSTRIAGRLTREGAAATGLPAGIPVVPGGGDVTALAVGCGVSQPGVLGVTLGTAGHVVLARNAGERLDLDAGLWSLPHADPARVLWLGLVMSGGLSLTWLHDLLKSGGSAHAFETLAGLALDVPAGSNGISFAPFLEGVATPYANPAARGTFSGLSPSTRAGDLVRAVMEGVAFNIRQCVDLFAASGGDGREIRLAEGGSRVDQWCQIIADILGRPVTRLNYLNTSSLGAALMANSGVTGTSLDALTASLAKGGRLFEPDPHSGAANEDAYRRYLAAAEGEIGRVERLKDV